MSSISKPDHCAERPCLVLLSAYQEYLMTFKLMTSQVVQRARSLSGRIWPLGRQRVNSHAHNSLVLNKSLFHSLPVSQCGLFSVFSRKNLFHKSLVSPITMVTNLVILAVSLWKVTLSQHFRLPRLQLPKTRWEKCASYNICLTSRNKKREENSPSPHFPCYSAPTHDDCGCFPLCQRFLKFCLEVKCKGPFRFLPTGIFGITSGGGLLFGRTGPAEICCSIFDKSVHCPTSLHLWREFGKGIKNGKSAIPLSWPGLIEKCCSIFLVYWHNGSTPQK